MSVCPEPGDKGRQRACGVSPLETAQTILRISPLQQKRALPCRYDGLRFVICGEFESVLQFLLRLAPLPFPEAQQSGPAQVDESGCGVDLDCFREQCPGTRHGSISAEVPEDQAEQQGIRQPGFCLRVVGLCVEGCQVFHGGLATPGGSLLLKIVGGGAAAIREDWTDGTERRDKTIAPFGDSLNGARSQRFAEGKDMNGEISFFDYGVRPDQIQQIVLRHHATYVLKENGEDLQSLRG